MPHVSVKANLIHDTILQWIAEGSIRPGDKLPSEADLARRLRINSRTVRRGLAELVHEGVIVKQHRVGNFVRRFGASRFAMGIGVMMPAYLFRVESHAAPAQILRGAGRPLDPRQYNLHIMPYEKWRLWEDAGQLAVDKSLAGAILLPVRQVRRRHLRQLTQTGMKVVMVQPPAILKGKGVGWIAVNLQDLMRQLLEGLVERGHRRMLIMHYELEHEWESIRSAVDGVFARHRLGSPDEAIVELPNLRNVEQIGHELQARLAGAAPPTVIVAPDEIAANTVFQFCYARGIRVPDDLSLAAFTNFAPQLNPVPLTSPDSVALRLRMLGEAAEHLVKLIEADASPAGVPEEAARWEQGIVLGGQVQWKASVAEIRGTHSHTGGPS